MPVPGRAELDAAPSVARGRVPRSLAALLAVYLALGALFSVTLPLWEAPDAIWHYHFVAHLAAGGGLPDRADAGLDAPWRQQGSQPPLYYLAAAPLVAAVDTSDAPDVIRENPHAAVGVAGPGGNVNKMVHSAREGLPWRGTVLAARLVGLLGLVWGALAVAATWGLAREALPDRPAVATGAAALLALNPQFLFLSGAISNDVAATATAALALWQMARLLGRGTSPPRLVALGLACGLAGLSKLSGFWLLPLAAGVVVVAAAREAADLDAGAPVRGAGVVTARAVAALAAFGLPVALTAGLWVLRNWLVFGDPTGLPVMLAVMTPRAAPPGPAELADEAVGVWKSFWAVFGWFNVPAPGWVYALATVVTGIGLGGLAADVARRRLDGRAGAVLAVAALWLALMVLALLAWAQVRYPQGRLLFPAAPALAVLVATGWLGGLADAPARRVAAGLAGTWAAVALWLLLSVVRPAYAPPPTLAEGPIPWPTGALSGVPVSVAGVGRDPGGQPAPGAGGSAPGSAVPGLAVFGDVLALEAAEVEGPDLEAARPGDRLVVTLYWSALRQPDRDWSVALHLVDEDDVIVAQRDSYPGSGNGPTRDWRPGARVVDRHVLELPPAAAAPPCACRLVLHVYDHATGRSLPAPGGPVEIARVTTARREGPGGVPNPVDVAFGEHIRLVGLDQDTRAAEAGEKLHLTLYWRALRTPPADYRVSVQLRRGDETWGQVDEAPADSERPTSGWRPGEVVRDAHALRVAEGAPPGVYRLSVVLYHPRSGPLPVRYRDPEWVVGSFRVLP